MIVIEDYDFKMEQVKSSPFFNLSMMVAINEGKENERYELKIVGYGLPFESCLKKIVSYKLEELDITCSVSEYLELYTKETDNLMKLFKRIKEPDKIKEDDNSGE